jgi:hypothetical protein
VRVKGKRKGWSFVLHGASAGFGVTVYRGHGSATGRRAKKKKRQTSLCSDNVAVGRGWHSREIKLKESKLGEGHVPLG